MEKRSMKVLSASQLAQIYKKPVLFDANVFMVGIENRLSDKYCSFEHIKSVLLIPLLESFENILIDIAVYNELDNDSKTLVNEYLDNNVEIVDISELYGRDPIYTNIYNEISIHELFRHKERSRDHIAKV